MLSHLNKQGHLVLAHPVYGSPVTSTLRQPPQLLPSQRHSGERAAMAQIPPEILPPSSDSANERGGVTDIMSTGHSWSAAPPSCAEVPRESSRSHESWTKPRVGIDETDGMLGDWYAPRIEWSQAHARWVNIRHEANALPSPPETPRPRRLRTPKIEPVKESRRFCSCCRPTINEYQEGRTKMDSQSELAAPSCHVGQSRADSCHGSKLRRHSLTCRELQVGRH